MKESDELYLCNLLKFLKNSQIKTMQVPHSEGLWMRTIMNFARQKLDIDKYLPVFKRSDKVTDQEWTWNMGMRWVILLYNEFPNSNRIQKVYYGSSFKEWGKIFDENRRWDRSYSWIQEIVPKANHIIKQDLSWYNYI